jgi:transcriptional regulator with XRE-family HTH domain
MGRDMKSDPSPTAGETIGQRLKRLRLERGLSQRDLAAPGVSYAYISRIEAGTRQPSVKALRKLAAKLGVSADFLETGSTLGSAGARELRLVDLELAVRLGDWDDLEAPLEGLVAEANVAGDRATASRARVALAAISQDRGEFERTASLLEAALDGEPFLPVDHFEIYANLGRAYAAAGRPQQAAELFERCIEVVEHSTDVTLGVRYATLLSYALSDMGELVRAEAVVERALEQARDTQDPYMRVRLYWSLARLAHAEGRESVALTNARKAIALLQATDDSFHLARAHLLAAGITLARDDADAAESHLDNADRFLGASPSVQDTAEITILRARIATLRGAAEPAVALARDALALVQGNSPTDEGYASAALADALTLAGDLQAAKDSYRHAVDLLENQGRLRDAARTCRAWSRMLRQSNHEAEALDVLERATALGLKASPAGANAAR